ncbi:TetR/AcrR family transcriptional regulator [Paucilactobacillus suebicus]|nr:TetR/AcrR family transcriptional regulator [Paucilactobacillus suebicus]
MTINKQSFIIPHMRTKDESKIEALHQAVIDVINHDGYQNLSVAKIAKKAGVSVATLYIYYSDKKDMLGKVYLKIKDLIDAKLFNEFDPQGPFEQQFKRLLRNYADAICTYPEKAAVMRVFNSNPNLVAEDVYSQSMDLGKPVADLYRHGLEEKLIRQYEPEIFISFTFNAIDSLAQIRFMQGKTLTKDEVDQLIEMAWAACKQN